MLLKITLKLCFSYLTTACGYIRAETASINAAAAIAALETEKYILIFFEIIIYE